jgi:putative FmdB family regulatory protein
MEKFQSMTDKPLKKCPSCKGLLRRLISAGAGILFKGSGFYQTDYRSEQYKKREREEKGKSSAGSSQTGGKDSPKSGTAPAGGATGKPCAPAN